jgi:hypothetical protein
MARCASLPIRAVGRGFTRLGKGLTLEQGQASTTPRSNLDFESPYLHRSGIIEKSKAMSRE